MLSLPVEILRQIFQHIHNSSDYCKLAFASKNLYKVSIDPITLANHFSKVQLDLLFLDDQVYSALQVFHKEALRLYLKSISYSERELIIAADYGRFEIVKHAIEIGVDPSADHNEAIRNASHQGHLNIVKLLLEDERVDPTDSNGIALRWACSEGHSDIVEILLEDKRIDPSTNIADTIAILNNHLNDPGYENIKSMVLKALEDSTREKKYDRAEDELYENYFEDYPHEYENESDDYWMPMNELDEAVDEYFYEEYGYTYGEFEI